MRARRPRRVVGIFYETASRTPAGPAGTVACTRKWMNHKGLFRAGTRLAYSFPSFIGPEEHTNATGRRTGKPALDGIVRQGIRPVGNDERSKKGPRKTRISVPGRAEAIHRSEQEEEQRPTSDPGPAQAGLFFSRARNTRCDRSKRFVVDAPRGEQARAAWSCIRRRSRGPRAAVLERIVARSQAGTLVSIAITRSPSSMRNPASFQQPKRRAPRRTSTITVPVASRASRPISSGRAARSTSWHWPR
jgi:hypothetical protein